MGHFSTTGTLLLFEKHACKARVQKKLKVFIFYRFDHQNQA